MTQILTQTSTGETLSLHTFTYNGQDLRAQESLDGSAIPPAPAIPETNTTYTTNDVNQLLSTLAPDRTFVYDLDGNMTQGYTKDGYVFTASYDAENRMTSMQYTDSSSVLHRQEFAYSGDGLVAIERTYENGTLVSDIRIMRDGMLPILDKDGSTNATLRQYTWGLNLGGGIGGLLHLYSASAGQNYAYLYDGKGNVEAMLDNSESVVAAYRYDPFGKLLAKTGSLEQPFGFSTKRYNAPVGMVQYEARNYFPPIGRWDSRDPLGEAGGLNLYAFVGNNPVNWVDPWGLVQVDLTDPELEPLVKSPWPEAEQYYGESQQCVSLTKYFTGLPCTDCWRAGKQVVGNDIEPGTAMATFDEDGRYPKGSEKNSGIYLDSIDEGIVILDQWPGHKARARLMRPGGRPQNNPNAYFVITVPAGTTSSKCKCGGE